ncbi:hypothetical protein EDB95_5487 [Dinghuibacter silviterrae]|uniref:Uncharacterized protein n=2 Tax=Dinghuibacter silviterrae TaxID=1539049 RepID=A0A4R8DJ71_9BACT|nr:hypothetical protein EDB95_5487 [Dinghuibacter silviterrae]
MKVDLTYESVFGFDGPNLCLLGNEGDYAKLAKSISEFTAVTTCPSINIRSLDFVENEGLDKAIIFSSELGANTLGVFDNDQNLIFKLDPRIWERIFKYFVFMSWKKSTYYLNCYENALSDLDLIQECNFICSSEF